MLENGYVIDNKYVIREHLGSGGGGNVYRAVHLGLDKYVAVKEIKDEVKNVLDSRAEADMLKNLKNDYIPIVYDFVRDGNNMYTVMEFVEGQSFQSLPDSGKSFGRKDILKFAVQLCTAAAYLHSRKPPVIHSDIKPANIMLRPDGNICLIDYNISLYLSGDVRAIGVSDGYSPPEQYAYIGGRAKANSHGGSLSDTKTLYETDCTLTESTADKNTVTISEKNTASGRHKIDARSDVYAIGASLIHIASGKKPVISADGSIELPYSENITDSMAAVLKKAVSPDPSKRFSDGGKMLKALGELKKYDKRYRSLVMKQEISAAAVIALMGAACVVSAVGYLKTGTEKQELYMQYVSQADTASLTAAAELFPQRAEAYEKQARLMFDDGEYAAAAEYIKGVLSIGQLYTGEDNEAYDPSVLYRLLGRCFMESEDYTAAAEALENAAAYGSRDADNFCDYSVALARCGRTEDAERALDTAVGYGLSDDGILFARGEIEYASGNYSSAIELFGKCIDITENDDMKYRAYIICGNAYAELFAADDSVGRQRIDFLKNALDSLPLERSSAVYEQLGQAYTDEAQSTGNMTFYADAADIYEKMNRAGWESFYTDTALIRLYRILGNYKYAQELALKLLSDGSGDYTVYKLLAYTEADIQNEKETSERDYSTFEEYYLKAAELCTESDDLEMRRLNEAYEQLRKEGYLK